MSGDPEVQGLASRTTSPPSIHFIPFHSIPFHEMSFLRYETMEATSSGSGDLLTFWLVHPPKVDYFEDPVDISTNTL